MCTIYFAYKVHEDYPLILIGNRDEFYKRPTKPAHFWEEDPSILAGIDLKDMGTWTGITRNGYFSFLTNYRDFSLLKTNPPSRGELVKDFLLYRPEPDKYLHVVEKKGKLYNPFNLVVGNMNQLAYYSNIDKQVRILPPDIYGLSNHLLNTPWPKVSTGKMVLQSIVDKGGEINPDDLFRILDDRTISPDNLLPDTGIAKDLERKLSPTFVDMTEKGYGTRIQYVILVDKHMQATFHERYRNEDDEWIEQTHDFRIVPIFS